MQTLETLETINESEKLFGTASETRDCRFAVINGQHFDLTSFNGCSDGNNYDAVTVYSVPDCCNFTFASEYDGSDMGDPLKRYVFTNDETGAAQALFLRLIAEALAT